MDEIKLKILEEIKKVKAKYKDNLAELIRERDHILNRYKIFLENKKNEHE